MCRMRTTLLFSQTMNLDKALENSRKYSNNIKITLQNDDITSGFNNNTKLEVRMLE